MEIDESAPGNKSQQRETHTTDNETGHDSGWNDYEVPLPPDDESPVDEDMADAQTTHSEAGRNGYVDDPDADPQMNEQDEDEREQRSVPASDPESGA